MSTCLNPLHTALAIFGCLLGYDRIYEEMRDENLVKLVNVIAYDEGMPVVTDPGIISPQAFAQEVITKRFPNPFIPDAPQRIATDTSNKLCVRFGETIKAYMISDTLDPAGLKAIPFVLAGWLRYLKGMDDDLNAIQLSADPRLDEMQAIISEFDFGGAADAQQLKPILSRTDIFHADLYEGTATRPEAKRQVCACDIISKFALIERLVHGSQQRMGGIAAVLPVHDAS
ncbi:MAG: hypothetical protein ACOX63_08075 [Christensenellales bacterium]